MSSPLRPVLADALAALNPGASIVSLEGDASARRFHRLLLAEGGSRIVMDYGAPFEGETDDVRLARIFEAASLPVARVLDVLPEAGALVLEDLGDRTFEEALGRSGGPSRPSRDDLYRAAVELSADIALRGTPALARSERSVGPALDEDRFRFEMSFFLTHFVEGFLGRPKPGGALPGALNELARAAATHPRVFCHRDFHSRNVMIRADGSLALVDIQDARWGPDTYDLASLLRDAYVDLDEQEVAEWIEFYRRQLPHPPTAGEFRGRFDVVGAQRMIKALGTFGYQVSKLGRDRYRSAAKRTLERLERLLPSRVETAALASAFDAAGLFRA